jgi:hypothetical protein
VGSNPTLSAINFPELRVAFPSHVRGLADFLFHVWPG